MQLFRLAEVTSLTAWTLDSVRPVSLIKLWKSVLQEENLNFGMMKHLFQLFVYST